MAVVKISRFDVLLISLDPSIGSEMKKVRPCVVISPDEMNKYINTIIIAPMTTTLRKYPTRIEIDFNGTRGSIVLDQIRTIDKSRIIKNLGSLDIKTVDLVIKTISEMFAQ